jgi:hypothetical protein
VPASRYLLLLAGILGVLALFQPMIGLGRGPVKIELSAYDLSFGLGKTHLALDVKIPAFAAKRIPPDVLSTREDIKLVADASKGAALAYLPAAIVLLLGAFSIWRKRTPKPVAVIAGVLGLISIAAWFGVRYAVMYGIEEEPALERLHFKAVFGAHVLLVAGISAVLASLAAFRKVDA